MARTFTSAFLAQARSKSAKPYLVLEVDWGGGTGTRYYLDRPANSFSASGARIPSANVDSSVTVLQWPSVSLALKEGSIGSTEQTQVTLDDASGAITAILNAAEQQRKLVTVYRMFDDPSCVWGTDNAEIFTGVLRPFDWTAKDNQIVLNLGDLGPLLAKSVSCIASKAIFPNIPNSYQDRNIPTCWGNAQRVEAVLVNKPWSTAITQNTDGSSPVTVTIADDPTDMGVDGTGHTTYQGWLGLDAVQVTFTQSSSPGTGTSTATITKLYDPTLATAVILGTVDGAGASRLIIQDLYILPASVSDTLGSLVGAGTNCIVVSQILGTVTTTLSTIITNSPWPGWYTVNFALASSNFRIGDTVKFLKNGTPMRAWPQGTVLRAYSGGYVYLANSLPSKNIVRVEGFGSVTDQAGNNRKDFIPLGTYKQTYISGSSTTTSTGDAFTVNLNDSTWTAAWPTGLGHHVTSITFTGSPRDVNNNLDDDRLWVTVQGVEDIGNSTGNLITNPATIILQYLENPNLMDVSAGSINAASFTAAAAALAGYDCGFAQIEAVDGLSYLQHIADCCHSILFFDQGQANMVVLSDSPGTIQATFDTTTNDNLLQGSLSVAEAAVDDTVNDLTFKWRQRWDDKTGQNLLDCKQLKLTSIAAFGRIAREKNPVDVFFRRQDVVDELAFWLGHWSSVWRTVSFTAFLDALILQPGDWIDVEWIDGGGRNLFGGAKAMQVVKCTDSGKNGLTQVEARFVAYTYT